MLSKLKELLQKTENRESFFCRIGKIWPATDPKHKLIKKAYDDAKDSFRDQYRDGGDRYFEHVRLVTIILVDYLYCRDHEMIIASLLHDNVEDLPHWPIDRVQSRYGERVAMLVDYLSKRPSEDFDSKQERNDNYHETLQRAPRDVIAIKACDRIHNLLTLWDCSHEKLVRKVKETRCHYLPLFRHHFLLCHEVEAACVALLTESSPAAPVAGNN